MNNSLRLRTFREVDDVGAGDKMDAIEMNCCFVFVRCERFPLVQSDVHVTQTRFPVLYRSAHSLQRYTAPCRIHEYFTAYRQAGWRCREDPPPSSRKETNEGGR